MASRWLGGLVARQQGWKTQSRASGLAFSLAAGVALSALALSPAAQAGERGPRDSRAATAATVAADEDASNARVIVKYRAGSELARLGALAGRARHAAHLGQRLALPMADGRSLGAHMQGLRGQGLSSRQLAARLSAQPDVEWAVVDQRRTATALPNDPFFGAGQTSITPAVGQWYLRAPDSSIVSAINAPAAWDVTLGSAAITVAVLDTGARFDHPDLLPAAQGGKLWPGYDFVRASASNDGDGRDADASDPGDWSVASDSCGASDSSWHGTQVAGLIAAATDNGQGMASIGRQVMVLPVRVLGKCGGFDDDILAALLWAAGLSTDASLPVNPHPAQVINLSLGGVGDCLVSYQDVLDRLTKAKVTVVVAAGNTTGLKVDAPGNCSGVITVGGVRHAGTKVGYSSLGPQVALAAPAGNCVNDTGTCLYPLLTTINAGSTTPGANTYSDGSKPSLGTSFSTPLVAGTVALMLSVDPTLTPVQVKAILQSTARPFPTTGAQTVGAPSCHAPSNSVQVECYCSTSTCGAGLLDAGAAVAKAAGTTLPPLAVMVASANSQSVGGVVDLDAGPSSRSVTTFQWSLVSGAAIAAISGASDGPSIHLTSSGAGDVVVRIVVADSVGATASEMKTINLFSHPTAVISATPLNPTAGDRLVFNAAGSFASLGRSISGYQWAVTGAVAQVGLVSASNASTVTLQANAGGTVQLSLTVTDSAGEGQTTSQSFTVAAAPVAVIRASSVTPAAGVSVALDGGGSTAALGRSLTAFRWAITSGAALGTLTVATDGRSATLVTSAVGEVVLSLTVTDNTGASRSTSQTLTILAVPVVVVTPAASGGGALGGGWLLGLAAAVGLLARWPRREAAG